jgi:ornithine carbamoyltransferase
MGTGQRLRHLLRDDDLTPAEQAEILDLADALKAEPFSRRPLEGPRSVAVLFDKSSTRTRLSFETGIAQLGGTPLIVDAAASQLGRGESIADTARVMSRYVAAIVWRTGAQARIEEMAGAATVPVVNALTDEFHPCQVLADLLTIRESLGGWEGKTVAWIGDGNNMANSWLNAAGVLGFELRLACPEGYQPNREILERNRKLARITLTADPREAARGAHVLNTDVWASMGQEEEQEVRARAFQGYIVDEALMATADRSAIFLHCLPAHRGEEVSDGVIEGPKSQVWNQAENRLHVQKALLATLMGDKETEESEK